MPVSFLQAEGAKDVGIEFHSLSKSYNMTGWRIGMAVGNATLIDALMRVKSNVDSGISAGDPADGDRGARRPAGLHRRAQRDLPAPPRPAGEALAGCGLRVTPPKASLYIWARVPEGMTSAEFAARLIEDIGVVVTPGNGYGAVRRGLHAALAHAPDDRVEEGARRLMAWQGGAK